ncbi:uncharacterized protein LOC111919973 [Lactuca sativa]|uniref:Transmembrane protein n=1 Tax=Lactuca sativa TaxID=4236 RepID=A0A9R1VGR1_LACSA|nr:uncharacterized protein LOC111919973 [Lactuca sativa]KAJ0206872.1 hypothetical protein LSAT_V11C500274960 [Lactuca sativa]
MLHSAPHLLLSSSSTVLLPTFSLLPNSRFLRVSKKPYSLSQQYSTRPLAPLLAQLPDSALPEDGPVELPFSIPSFISTDDDPTTLQVATSVLLTGAVSIFLFRSLRRRAKRAKELKFRSTGTETKKTLKEEALESLKAMTPVEANAPPSPLQALLGGLSAGIIAIILYKFTSTIEASLNRQTISDNFSVRQITITIRTIINGICYLATFVFGINAVGLILYSGQLGLNSIMGDSPSEKIQNKEETQSNSIQTETNKNDEDQSRQQ